MGFGDSLYFKPTIVIGGTTSGEVSGTSTVINKNTTAQDMVKEIEEHDSCSSDERDLNAEDGEESSDRSSEEDLTIFPLDAKDAKKIPSIE